ncbi:MAG: efflux RND transporter permease subunit, partial [Pseudomonadota bacterium]
MSPAAQPSASSPTPPSYGFGLERIGLLAAHAPWATVVFLVAFSALSAFGLANLAPQGSLSELFRSDTPAFKTYERLRDRFPTSEFDVLLVVEGNELATPAGLEKARSLHLEMEFAEGVAGVLSVFSMRGKPDAEGYPPPIVPVELPEGPAFDRLFQEIATAEMVQDRFLAAGGDGVAPLAVMVVSLALETLSREAIDTALVSIRSTVASTLEGSQLQAQLSGAPIMQSEIRDAIKRDRLIFNTAGFIVGFLICWFFLRRGVFVLITALCPPLAVLWAMGMLGLFDIRLNTFVNVIPPLVMVIAFSDSMHMVFSIRRALMNGATPREAAIRAVRNVGPACALTSLTTALALFAMVVTDSSLIQQFGIGAGMATLLAFLAVITIVPTVTVLVCREVKPEDRDPVSQGNGALDRTQSRNEMAAVAGSASGIIERIEQRCRGIARWVTGRQRAIVAVTIP